MKSEVLSFNRTPMNLTMNDRTIKLVLQSLERTKELGKFWSQSFGVDTRFSPDGGPKHVGYSRFLPKMSTCNR